jgi:carbonic anhydrase/acetyltransferase-like protein (isoleucine patch superfamily)
MALYEYGGVTPKLGKGAYVAPSADLIGRVRLGRCSSVWFGSVLRGDINEIVVGDYTNVQDLSVGHVDDDKPLVIGDFVTIGHGAVVHGCSIGDGCLIGMRALVLSSATIGAGSVVGAGSLVREGTDIPPGVLAVGSPARVIREITEEEKAEVKSLAEKYSKVAETYLKKVSK